MDAATQDRTQFYPGGAEHRSYRLAFRVWVLFFLLLISVGLLNYLATVMNWGGR